METSNMIFTHLLLDEPDLEFGDGGKHPDPRMGLVRYGPLQPVVGDRISLGVIGTAETVEGFERWMERLKAAIPGKSDKQPNLFPPFPGLGNENPFRCRFEVSPTARRVLPIRDVADIVSIKGHSDAVRQGAALFTDQATAMLEGSDKPDVIVAALPIDLIMRMVNDLDETGEEEGSDDDPIDFRDLLKAQTLHLQRPTQLVWPTLWDDHVRIPRKLRKTMRRVQDPATRAWNVLNAMFYKAGRAPWRLPRPEEQLKTTYVGIGFYRDLSGQRLLTSTAQMFDERGRGLILRSGRARVYKGDLHPYLDRADAYDLLRRSLVAYHAQHFHYPARVVILKTSRFETKEADGFCEALKENNIAYCDLVWVSESSPITMFREGAYPPLRGTMILWGNEAILFTRGSVPIYRTYPGLRVPRPIMLRPQRHDTPVRELGKEFLALGKMNWNTTQFDGALPIPIRAARQVGKVLRHVPIGQREATEYPHYM
jgi:hypothetical protein